MSYEKQNFSDGQTLKAEHLNKIEEGIVANEKALDEKQPKGDYATKSFVNERIEAALNSNKKIEVEVLKAACSLGGQWMTEGDYESYLIPVNAGDTYIIDPHKSTQSAVHFLMDFTNFPEHWDTVDTTGGRKSKVDLLANTRLKGTIEDEVKYICITTNYNGSIRTPQAVFINGVDVLAEEEEETAETDTVKAMSFDVAANALDQSCLSDSSADHYVGYRSVSDHYRKVDGTSIDVVAVGHDDLPAMDYIGTRKIYNKYGFKGTFNFMLTPFANKDEKLKAQENIKKMVKDGHHIGLHAVMGDSFFWRDPMADVRPDGTTTFTPTLSELQGEKIDVTIKAAMNKGGTWYADSTYESYLIPVQAGDSYIINTHKTAQSYVHFLADFTSFPEQWGTADSTGGRVSYLDLFADQQVTGTIEDGVKYMCITTLWNSDVRTPQAVFINGVDAFVGDTNVFGKTVNETTKFSSIGFVTLPDAVNKVVMSATATDWLDVVSCYSVYGRTSKYSTHTGLDLEDKAVTKSILGWLEYWYNELIDGSLGYSDESVDLATRFSKDYSGAYPTVEEIKSGIITSDGAFTKGLFKGCKTCCNYEVIGRIIDIAEAFVQHYFGIDKFDNMAYHGVGYMNMFWTDANGVPYRDRDKTILANGYTPMYISLDDRKKNLFDIFKDHNIRINKRLYPVNPLQMEGQIGMYLGQKDIRGAFFHDVGNEYDYPSYFALLSTGSSGSGMESISLSKFRAALPETDQKKLMQYVYENASAKAGDYYITSHLKTALNRIKSARGTGRIPFLGLDTISNSASIVSAIELLCMYCYYNNIRIVSMEEARQIANMPRIVNGNMFPNPTFKRSLIDFWGQPSTSGAANIPDGWYNVTDDATLNVAVDTIDGNRAMTIGGGSSYNTVSTRVYGLPAGKYRFSAMVKGDGLNPVLRLRLKKNGELVSQSPTAVLESTVADTFTEVSTEFVIPEPYQVTDRNTLEETLCDGYNNNVAYVSITLYSQKDKTTSIYSPKIVKVE